MKLRPLLLYLPPPVITAVTAFMMWWSQAQLDLASNKLSLPFAAYPFALNQWLALLVALLGLGLMLLAAHTLRRSRTTLLPFKPSQTRHLVSHGVFGYSRNPIYVGDSLLLVAWALWLGTGIGLLWLALFLLYMTKVQIAAEEQALEKKFGADYHAYCQRVRRWL